MSSRNGEEAFVAWLQAQSPRSPIGDDTAPLGAKSGLVVTVDQQIEGTHFSPGLDPQLLGQRLARVNLSDLAAAGARPRWALLALALPAGDDPRPIVAGVVEEGRRFGFELVGGDIAQSEQLGASLTLVGERRPGSASLGRERARPGQTLWLGGTVGESALGCELVLRGAHDADAPESGEVRRTVTKGLGRSLSQAARRAVRRNLLPTPQLELGRWLAGLGPKRAGAAIDVSDGLAKDLRRLCTASEVGAELDLPLLRQATSPLFEALATEIGLDPIAVALAGGEDYVLLFTLPAGVAPPPRFGCFPIGRTVRGHELTMLDGSGGSHELPLLGWDHLS